MRGLTNSRPWIPKKFSFQFLSTRLLTAEKSLKLRKILRLITSNVFFFFLIWRVEKSFKLLIGYFAKKKLAGFEWKNYGWLLSTQTVIHHTPAFGPYQSDKTGREKSIFLFKNLILAISSHRQGVGTWNLAKAFFPQWSTLDASSFSQIEAGVSQTDPFTKHTLRMRSTIRVSQNSSLLTSRNLMYLRYLS